MQKPSGYDEAPVSGEFTPIELGGHYAVVKQVTETQTKDSGKDMIVVLFDFATRDKQAGYFKSQFENDDREDKKWPFPGSKYIMVHDYNDPSKTSKQFKTFCSCIQKSNNYTITWGGNNWGKQFVGKQIGVVYGEEESEYDGKIRMRHVPKWFCNVDKVADASIPQPKYLNGSSPAQTTQEKKDTSFVNIDDSADEEIPF